MGIWNDDEEYCGRKTKHKQMKWVQKKDPQKVDEEGFQQVQKKHRSAVGVENIVGNVGKVVAPDLVMIENTFSLLSQDAENGAEDQLLEKELEDDEHGGPEIPGEITRGGEHPPSDG